MASSTAGERSARVLAVGTQLIGRICDVLRQSGLSREYARLGCFSRRELIEFSARFAAGPDAVWRAEDFIQTTDLMAVLAGIALQPEAGGGNTGPIPEDLPLALLWEAEFWAEIWIKLAGNHETAVRMADDAVDIDTLMFECYEPPLLKQFHDDIEALADAPKPEEFEAQMPAVQDAIRKRRLHPREIIEDIDDALMGGLGFALRDIEAAFKASWSLLVETNTFPSLPLRKTFKGKTVGAGTGVIPEAAFRAAFERAGGRSRAFDPLVQAFGYMRPEPVPTLSFISAQRHRAIFPQRGVIYVNPFGLANGAEAFMQAVLTGHHVDRYGGDPSKLDATQRKAGDRFSTFLAHIVADRLVVAGKVLPMQGSCPQVEIKCIVSGRVYPIEDPPGRDLGDLDVLYFDPRAKEIRILELKHFKPGTDNRSSLVRADASIDGALARKMAARHKWIERHLAQVCDFLKVESGDYRVRTTLVASRPMPFETSTIEATALHSFLSSLP